MQRASQLLCGCYQLRPIIRLIFHLCFYSKTVNHTYCPLSKWSEQKQRTASDQDDSHATHSEDVRRQPLGDGVEETTPVRSKSRLQQRPADTARPVRLQAAQLLTCERHSHGRRRAVRHAFILRQLFIFPCCTHERIPLAFQPDSCSSGREY